MPRRRAREMPMMSAKWKDFDSEVGSAAFQVRRPSVRVPSTSKAMAWRVRRVVGSKGMGLLG